MFGSQGMYTVGDYTKLTFVLRRSESKPRTEPVGVALITLKKFDLCDEKWYKI